MYRLIRCALVLAGLILLPAQASGAACAAGELRAMTYNIRLDTPSDGPNQWAHRRDLLVGQLRLLRPAILGLQEVVPGQRADLAAAMPGYTVLGGGRDDGRNAGEASPLLIETARFRIAESGMFWLSSTPDVPSIGWDAAFRRVASWARLSDRVTGRRVLAINTHWDHVGLAARRNSAAQLAEWIARHARRGEAVLLLGDFNAPLGEPSMQALLVPNGRFVGLRDARSASREPPVGATTTFNGWELVPKPTAAIDHLLVGPGLEVMRYHVLAAHSGGRLASDHFAVVADLAFSRSVKGCAAVPPA